MSCALLAFHTQISEWRQAIAGTPTADERQVLQVDILLQKARRAEEIQPAERLLHSSLLESNHIGKEMRI